jgi:hypothetical protein
MKSARVGTMSAPSHCLGLAAETGETSDRGAEAQVREFI